MSKFDLSKFLVENKLTQLGRLTEIGLNMEDKDHTDILSNYGFEIKDGFLSFENKGPVFKYSEEIDSDGVKQLVLQLAIQGGEEPGYQAKELSKTLKTSPYIFKLDSFGKRELISFLKRVSGVLANLGESTIQEMEQETPISEEELAQQAIAEKEDIVEPTAEVEEDFSKYGSVEELMKEIERSTNEAALKHKMERVRKAYESIESKATSLEEGEHAQYLAPGKIKEMRRSSKELRKMHERLLKEYEKRFPVKKKSELNEVAEEGGQVIEKNLQDLTWNDMELAFPGLGKERDGFFKSINNINLPIPTLRGEMLTIHSEDRFNEWKEHMLKLAGDVKVTLDASQKWFDQVKLDANMEDLFRKKA